MSGPKVIRIVSREEVLEICRLEMARFDAAIAGWQGVVKRNGLNFPTEVIAQRSNLQQLLRSDQFLEIQKQVPLLIARLDAQMEDLLAERFSAQAREARGRAGVAASAASLLQEFTRRELALPDDLLQGLSSGDEAAQSRAVAAAISLLAASVAEPLVQNHDLLSRLRSDHKQQPQGDWLTLFSSSDEDPRLVVANRHIGYLEAMGASSEVFVTRLQSIQALSDLARRGILLDALCLDLAGDVRLARERMSLLRDIVAVEAELSLAATSLDQFDIEELRSYLSQIQEQRKAVHASRLAVSTREAVLRGLSQLGYQVREGMGRSWDLEGKLVLRHPSRDGYGVEFGGRGDKLQVRAVSFKAADAAADKAAEERWCGELGKLHDEVAALGGELQILRSTPVGAQPVKKVLLMEDDEERQETEELQQRRMPT